jgi:hypothetical protein
MTRARLPIVAALVALGLGLAGAAPAAAQSPGPAPEAAPKAKAFSANDLQSFARAAVKVKKLNEVYMPKLQAAETPEEQQAVRRDATAKMAEAVEKEGLSVDKYNEIYLAARSDPEVADEVNKLIEKER